ncbi:MAG: hypothetical protein FJX11_22355 [Alphaproteobacteria bacterium]|nr:hypothetical protein [Alphaproteobacteria bacterium]
MPLHWIIDSKARLFTAVAEGGVSYSEATALLDPMAGANATTYRKLFDGRTGSSTMSPDELLTVCARIRSLHDNTKIGALAVVANAEQTVVYARLLGVLASAERPIKLFGTPRQARSWLDEQPII